MLVLWPEPVLIVFFKLIAFIDPASDPIQETLYAEEDAINRAEAQVSENHCNYCLAESCVWCYLPEAIGASQGEGC